MSNIPSSSSWSQAILFPAVLLLLPLEGNPTGWPPDPGLCLEPCERFCTLKAKLANLGFLTALWSVWKKIVFLWHSFMSFCLQQEGSFAFENGKRVLQMTSALATWFEIQRILKLKNFTKILKFSVQLRNSFPLHPGTLPSTPLLYHLQLAGPRKPRSRDLHQMPLKRVTDHD